MKKNFIDKLKIDITTYYDISKSDIQNCFEKAFISNDLEIIKLLISGDNLIEKGEDTKLPFSDSKGTSILTKIMLNYPQNTLKKQIFGLLLESKHIDVNSTCKCENENIKFDHKIIIHNLSEQSLFWAAELLIKTYNKIDINTKFLVSENNHTSTEYNSTEYNILLYLIKFGKNEALKLLLDNEHTINGENRLDYDSDQYGDFSPLFCAIKFNNNYALTLLLNKKSINHGYCVVDINKIRNGKTAYEFALETKNFEAVHIINPNHTIESITSAKDKSEDEGKLNLSSNIDVRSLPTKPNLLRNQLASLGLSTNFG